MDTKIIKEQYKKNKNIKVFKLLIIISVIAIILGIIYILFLSNKDKLLIKESFTAYFNNIDNNQFITTSFINNIMNNIVLTIVVWILGISIIGELVAIIYLIYKCFTLGFTMGSFIYLYGIKGVIPMIIYVVPMIINILCIFILTFYAIRFSRLIIKYILNKKNINMKLIIKRYTVFLLIILFILLIMAIISSFVVPIILKTWTKALI